MKKRCALGTSCGSTCINRQKKCVVELSSGAISALEKLKNVVHSGGTPSYESWKELARGYNGRVSISPDGTRVVKEMLVGADGEKGKFGEHEAEIARKMGDLGHSPRIHRATDDHLEMDVAPGKPIWKSFKREEGESPMNTAQAEAAAAAIRDLHKLGYFHGDMHSQQFLIDGNSVKLVDYGLSGPIPQNPVKVMQDLNKIRTLVHWENSELQGNPYVSLVNRHLDQYRAVKGTSKKAEAERLQIAENYLKELKEL